MINMIISYLVVSTMLLMVLSVTVTTMVTRRAVESELDRFNESFRLMSNSVNYVLESVYNNSFQIFNTDPVAQIAVKSNGYSGSDYGKLNKLMVECLELSPLISSVYFVNFNAGKVLSTAIGVFSIDRFADAEALELLMSTGKRELFTPRITDKGQRVISYCFSDMIHSQVNKSGMVVNLDMQEVNRLFGGGEAEGSMYILNNSGKVFFGGDGAHAAYIESALYPRIDGGNVRQGYEIGTVGKEEYLITYKKADRFGMIFVGVSPYSAIAQGAREIRNTILLVSLGIVLVGLIFSTVFLRRIYSPIKRLVEEIRQRSSKKDVSAMSEYELLVSAYNDLFDNAYSSAHYEMVLNSKKHMLHRLLMGSGEAGEDLSAALRSSGLPVKGAQYVVLVLRIKEITRLLSQYTSRDVNMLKYGIAKLAAETIGERFACESLENGMDYVTLLVNINPGRDVLEELEQLCAQAIYACRQMLSISVCCGISDGVCAPEEIHIAFKQARVATEYRLFFGTEAVVGWPQVEARENIVVEFPYSREADLLLALRLGKRKQAQEALAGFMQAVARTNIQDAQLFLTQLATGIGRAMRDESSGQEDVALKFAGRDMLAELQKIDSLEDKQSYIAKLIETFIAERERRQQQRHSQSLAGIIDYIHENCGDPALSIEDIAKRAGYSAGYMRRIFKDQYACSPNDYLLNIRIEKAKRLLAETDRSTKDIAHAVGYLNVKYFYSIFKKRTGMTTYEYKQTLESGQGEERAATS